MNTGDQNSQGAQTGCPDRNAHPRIRIVVSVMKWTAFTAFGLLVVVIMIGVGGIRLPFWFPNTDLTHKRPYADFVGREYRVTGHVTALAWNDFPDQTKILSVSLTPPSAHNRFVSYSIPLQPGQSVRIISAWRQFALVEFRYWYVVSVPGAGLPDGIPITMTVNSDGVPDPLLYEAIDKAGANAQH